jgi:biopolymer transport protein ExbD
MKQTGIEKRAARRNRNTSSVDLNLVSLIDIFTILIFFLLFNMGVAEILPNSKAIKLPESTAEKLRRAITIMGDKEIPYRLLRKVMVTCARADFTDVSFAVQKKGG